jgi:hypothetical protein
MDHSVSGVVSGLVINGNDEPQEAVALAAINLRNECAGLDGSGLVGSGRTDGQGRFVMDLDRPLSAAGKYCFDIAMTSGLGADTAKHLEIMMEMRWPPLDTTEVTLIAEW